MSTITQAGVYESLKLGEVRYLLNLFKTASNFILLMFQGETSVTVVVLIVLRLGFEKLCC